MNPNNLLQHPDITRALNIGGSYWDEKDELEWERVYGQLVADS